MRATSHSRPRRVATLMVHSSPLEQPGTGDAGGMNVYVVEAAKRMAESGVEVDIFTRATSSSLPPRVELAEGVNVHHLVAGPFEGLAKEELPAQLCAMASGLMRAEARVPRGHYDLIHSHYWLSGQVGWLASERWGVPLVHTMHTMAKVKNLALADGDTPEPPARAIGEEQVVSAAHALIANTETEAAHLVGLYGADPSSVHVVEPGVDLETFSPGTSSARIEARRALGIAPDAVVLAFVGRIQPHKGPDVLLRAAAELVNSQPWLRSRLVVAVVGGSSGAGKEVERLNDLANWLGIASSVLFMPPVDRAALPLWYRSADLVCVPSHSESFGLVALEAQACGTPVVAAAVGGLRTAVADGYSGVLIDGHEPRDWAIVLGRLIAEPRRRDLLAIGAVDHARRFGWELTASRTLDVYEELLSPFARTAMA
jgi:D-inositol-3-phosphate glycosyltransferase